jgi:hypothetical protein
LLIALLLTGCASGDGDQGGYPSLSSVPNQSRPSLPLEERRDIVRGLIKERDESRRHTSVVRGRSGLSTTAFPPPGDGDAEAEAIIPEDPAEAEAFTLNSESDGDGDASYRSGRQFDDGSLDDFIRQLERDTSPRTPDVAEEPASEEAEDAVEDQTSFLLHDVGVASPIRLAAFAPAITDRHGLARDVRIRLAADEDDRGFFCRRLGWAVGMLGVCTVDGEGESATGDNVGGDGQAGVNSDGGRLLQDENATGNGAVPESRRRDAERRLSGDDASDAIENLSRGALEPVKSSLEKLRDFMRARRSGDTDGSPAERRAYRSRGDASPQQASVDHPPIPLARPKLRGNIVIEDGGEAFEFKRMQHPAFKPTAADEPVIMKSPGREVAEKQTSEPAPKQAEEEKEPSALPIRPRNPIVPRESDASGATSGKDDDKASVTPEELKRSVLQLREAMMQRERAAQAEAAPGDQRSDMAALPPRPSASPSNDAGDDGLDWSSPRIIRLQPGSSDVSDENMARLDEILAHAQASGQKIQIIGEAGTTRLALRRATEIGAALVRLSATAEILEYDFNVVPGVDQVRLVIIKPTPEDAAQARDAG